MPNFTEKIKTTWFKCVESIGQSAANMADNAKQKLNEINMEARRKEVVADLPARLLQMWKDGAELPEELNEVLVELNGLEEDLAAYRAARLAKKNKPAITDGSDAEPAAEETVVEVEFTVDAAETASEEEIADAVEAAEEENSEVVESSEEASVETAENTEEATAETEENTVSHPMQDSEESFF